MFSETHHILCEVDSKKDNFKLNLNLVGLVILYSLHSYWQMAGKKHYNFKRKVLPGSKGKKDLCFKSSYTSVIMSITSAAATLKGLSTSSPAWTLMIVRMALSLLCIQRIGMRC